MEISSHPLSWPSLWNVENFSFYHHQFPPTIQRDDWTFQSFFKILPSSLSCWAGLGSTSSFSSHGSQDTPKEDSGYAPAEALFGTQLAVPGEFLDAPHMPRKDFFWKIDCAIIGFSGPIPHHTRPAPAKLLPKSLLSLDFVFVHEDSSVPPLSQLYRGPYKVVDRKDKYFKNSSYRLVLSKITNPLPPGANPPPPVRITNKSVCFSLPSRWNPTQAALLPRWLFVSTLQPMPLLGGCSVADQILRRHLLCSYLQPNQRC